MSPICRQATAPGALSIAARENSAHCALLGERRNANCWVGSNLMLGLAGDAAAQPPLAATRAHSSGRGGRLRHAI